MVFSTPLRVRREKYYTAAAAAVESCRAVCRCLVDPPTNFLRSTPRVEGYHGALSITGHMAGKNQEPESLVAHPSCHMGGRLRLAKDEW